ncbi:MAG: hypothetical protein AAF909_15220, partial [Pseudomonadota bacterium]
GALAALASATGSAEIQLEQAKGAVNLISPLGGAGAMSEARELYGDLAALASETGSAEIQLRQAQGAFNLISALGGAGAVSESRELYGALAALASETGSAEIQLEQAKGAFNLILHYASNGQAARIGPLVEDLEALHAASQGDPRPAQIWVCGLGVWHAVDGEAAAGLARLIEERPWLATAARAVALTLAERPEEADALLDAASDGDPVTRAWLDFLSTPGAEPPEGPPPEF